MLGDFIGRGLLMILGYAYPALECFKTVEKNRPNIDELRFWCQYWIIIALLSVVERFGDVFISWVPFYGELKLAFIIYLWYPKTMGTSYVYENLLRPFVTRHETDIEKSLKELRLRAWDLALYYWENCTELGQSAVFNVFEYLASQSSRLKGDTSKKNDRSRQRRDPPPTSSALHQRRTSPDSPRTTNRRRGPPQPAPSAPRCRPHSPHCSSPRPNQTSPMLSRWSPMRPKLSMSMSMTWWAKTQAQQRKRACWAYPC